MHLNTICSFAVGIFQQANVKISHLRLSGSNVPIACVLCMSCSLQAGCSANAWRALLNSSQVPWHNSYATGKRAQYQTWDTSKMPRSRLSNWSCYFSYRPLSPHTLRTTLSARWLKVFLFFPGASTFNHRLETSIRHRSRKAVPELTSINSLMNN